MILSFHPEFPFMILSFSFLSWFFFYQPELPFPQSFTFISQFFFFYPKFPLPIKIRYDKMRIPSSLLEIHFSIPSFLFLSCPSPFLRFLLPFRDSLSYPEFPFFRPEFLFPILRFPLLPFLRFSCLSWVHFLSWIYLYLYQPVIPFLILSLQYSPKFPFYPEFPYFIMSFTPSFHGKPWNPGTRKTLANQIF